MTQSHPDLEAHLHAAYLEHPLPRLPRDWPNGWMTPPDLRILYNAARRTNGDVLEVGPWLGRSTTALAAGLRDRVAEGQAAVRFDTVDFGVASAEEWAARFGRPLRLEKDKGRVAESVLHPGGTIALLIANLKGNDLLDQVTSVVRGDFIDLPFTRRYGLIFCDATHDDAEIARHLPRLAELSAPGAVLVFDDVPDEARADLICAHLPTRARFLSRAVLPERARRGKLLVVETT